MMVFLPVARSAVVGLRTGAGTIDAGCAATPALSSAHAFDSSMDEDANFQAQTYAMVSGLIGHLWPDGSRVVLAADIPAAHVAPAADTGFGTVAVSRFEWAWVQAVFSDGAEPDEETIALVRAADAAVEGLSMAAAVRADEVQRLVDEADLLWHLPDETW